MTTTGRGLGWPLQDRASGGNWTGSRGHAGVGWPARPWTAEGNALARSAGLRQLPERAERTGRGGVAAASQGAVGDLPPLGGLSGSVRQAGSVSLTESVSLAEPAGLAESESQPALVREAATESQPAVVREAPPVGQAGPAARTTPVGRVRGDVPLVAGGTGSAAAAGAPEHARSMGACSAGCGVIGAHRPGGAVGGRGVVQGPVAGLVGACRARTGEGHRSGAACDGEFDLGRPRRPGTASTKR